MHCKSKNKYNYNNNNYIPELSMTISIVFAGEFLLEWCEYFGQPQVWYISYVALLEPFYIRCESVKYIYIY